MKKIVNGIGNILCILLIIVLAVFEILKYSNFIYVLQVQTGSMETNIHVGDYILVKKTDDYKVGDIITFKVNDYYVTHRITSIDGNKMITKGDANNVCDGEIYKTNVIGKVVYKGDLLNFLFKYRPVLVLIAIAFFILSCFFVDNGKEDNKENNDIDDDEKDSEEKEEEEDNFVEKTKEKNDVKVTFEGPEEYSSNNDINDVMFEVNKEILDKDNKVSYDDVNNENSDDEVI